MKNQDWDDYENLAAEEYSGIEKQNNPNNKRLKERRRKWREIDIIKENFRLQKELAEINQYWH